MNRLALIIATGFMALALTACGEQGNKTPVGSNQQNTTTTSQPAQNQNQPAGGTQTQ